MSTSKSRHNGRR